VNSKASLVYCTTQNKKEKITKNEKPLSRVSPVYYSPRRQSRWQVQCCGPCTKFL